MAVCLLLQGSSRRAARFHRGLHGVFPTVVVAILRYFSKGFTQVFVQHAVFLFLFLSKVVCILFALPPTVGMVFWLFVSLLHP